MANVPEKEEQLTYRDKGKKKIQPCRHEMNVMSKRELKYRKLANMRKATESQRQNFRKIISEDVHRTTTRYRQRERVKAI